MTEGELKSWNSWLLSGTLILILTILPITGVFSLLLLTPWIPAGWVGLTLLGSGIVFLVGACVLISNRGPRLWIYSLMIGFSLGFGCMVLATLAHLSYIPIPFFGNAMNATLTIVTVIGFSIAWLWSSRGDATPAGLITTSSKSLGERTQSIGSVFQQKQESVEAVELRELPHDYAFAEDGGHDISKIIERFYSIIRSLSSIPFGLRIERFQWKTRVLFLTSSKNDAQLEFQRSALFDALCNNLPGFKFELLDSYKGIALDADEKGTAGIINGVPHSIEDETQRKDTLEAMIGVLQSLENGVYQVFVRPEKMSKSKLRSLEGQYKRERERTETTFSKESTGWLGGTQQESKTIVNLESKNRADKLERKFERMSSQHLFKASVAVLSWGKDITRADIDARRLSGALVGVLRPDNKQEDFTIEYKWKQKDIVKLLRGISVGDSTVLTAGETTTYFIISRKDAGIRVTKREKFSSGTRDAPEKLICDENEIQILESIGHSNVQWLEREPELYLGNPIDESGRVIPNVYVKIDIRQLNMHLGVYGATRMGKSTSVMSIVGQSITLGVNPLVLVPSKGYEWYWLLEVFPNLRIFTCGRSDLANLAINIWDPPHGVRLTKWIDQIVQVWTLWLPNDKVISMHIEDVIYTVYKNCEWNLETNTKGSPILLTDLVDALIEVGERLPYGDEVSRNIWGAMVSRVKSILRKPSLVKMYNTPSGITTSELLAHPTIIVMDDLSGNDKILLMGILTAAVSEYKLANPSKEITNLLVLEEAHYLLSRTDLNGEANSGVKQQAVSAFIQMIRLLGGPGLGVVLADQSPSELVSQAIKIPVNMIIHALPDEDDSTPVGKHTRCTDSQRGHIGGMQVGEAVVYLQNEGEPKNVKMLPLERFILNDISKKPLGEDDVRIHMTKVFEKNKHLRTFEPLPDGIMEKLTQRDIGVQNDLFPNVSQKDKIRLSEIVRSPEFGTFCCENLAKGNDRVLAELFLDVSKKYGDGSYWCVLFVLDQALEFYSTSKNRDVFKEIARVLDGEKGE
ncbi:MAG: ATP-binding protein [Candidatus Thorarchaeota archaeon]